ncbi:G protein-coupled receptor, rhodopsin-like family and GPCR, rhodopsin-like, 7TM domain-containing protein [Strongyloides ratti]|uniref:G protein-coupled receptor, rhodopsin-like family and GPCR, rhodopsin-like, 7TM domain-containing protein n=1 Tax=Strongyloides ratti TaxID=34506 RepID=A0A090LUM3_STRRB|nr:G protein-coupled receptor, rhodopsin-like family and GPCR, rhodopsin-like, 7TM domain-containing protein [Strongyloides ratti]CEF71324.1 G protein-coupled receptor, rhodopsin-like family and GPCR, rhodopsin-like, 7TM domain-containing protein [Strongyloides ratti]
MENSSIDLYDLNNITKTNNILQKESFPPEGCFDAYHPIIIPRFYLVCVAGFITSIISIIENSFLFFLFAKKKSNRNHYNLYLMLIAIIDVFMGISYILLMVVNVSADYFQSLTLLRLWYFYVIPMITVSHVAMTSSAMCILAATFERYCITVNAKQTEFVKKNRVFIALGSLVIAIFNKGSMYFEFDIITNETCSGTMNEYAIIPTSLIDAPLYVIFRVWCRNIATVFLPFFALAYLNARIVRALAKQQRLDYCADLILANSKNHPDKEKSRRKILTRSATRTLVLVVITYLISNVVNVILTVGEYVNKLQLQTYYTDAYFILLDASSLLCVLASALRFPIYMTCQSQLREEVFNLLKHKLRKDNLIDESNNSTNSNNNGNVQLLTYKNDDLTISVRMDDNVKSTMDFKKDLLVKYPSTEEDNNDEKIVNRKVTKINVVDKNIIKDDKKLLWNANDSIICQRLKLSEGNDFLQNIIFGECQKESLL